MSCEVKTIKRKTLCVGDLKYRIALQSRKLTGVRSGVDASEAMTTLATVWAGLETSAGKKIFDGQGEERIITHIFYIRYRSDITSENFVLYKGNNYDIIATENYNESDNWLVLYCNVRGKATRQASRF